MLAKRHLWVVFLVSTYAATATAQQITAVSVDGANRVLTASGSGLGGTTSATLGTAALALSSVSAGQVVGTFPVLSPGFYRLVLVSRNKVLATFDVDLTPGSGLDLQLLDQRYARLAASNTFEGNQQTNGTFDATTTEGVALRGTSHGTSGWSAGVEGAAMDNPSGVGVAGNGAWSGINGSGGAFGVIGVTSNDADMVGATGVLGDTDYSILSGFVIGVGGYTHSPHGVGMNAWNLSGGNGLQAGSMCDHQTEAVCDEENGTALTATSPGGSAIYAESGNATRPTAFFHNTGGGSILGGQGSNGSFNINANGNAFFSGGVTAVGQDFAEALPVRGSTADYQPADVLAIDETHDRRLTLAVGAYATNVAGVFSTRPGVVARAHDSIDPLLDAEVPLAVVGIVPCKVTTENGAITRGDLLVVSSTPGHAMKGTEHTRMIGAVVGKALQPLESGSGVILILVTLQ